MRTVLRVALSLLIVAQLVCAAEDIATAAPVWFSISDGALSRGIETKTSLAPTPTSSAAAPWCTPGASPHGDRSPNHWCNCGGPPNYSLTYSMVVPTAYPYLTCPYEERDDSALVKFTTTAIVPSPTAANDRTHVDHGNLDCLGWKESVSQDTGMRLEGVQEAISWFCAIGKKHGVVFRKTDGTSELRRLYWSEATRDSSGPGTLQLRATWNISGGVCGTGLDFSREEGPKTCERRLHTILDTCNPDKTNNELWKQGGTFYRDCLTWEISKAAPEGPPLIESPTGSGFM